MEPTHELADAIYRERVLRAWRTPPEVKLLSGADLFEGACERMREGLRAANPEADGAAIERLLRRRLSIARRLDEVR